MIAADSKALSGERKRATGLYDLPAELRNAIYDILSDTDAYVLSCTSIRPFDVPRLSDVEKIAQVNRQFRAEFLPRYHAIVGLALYDYDRDDRDVHLSNSWLRCFGATRVPLTRRFVFYIGHDTVITLQNDGDVEISELHRNFRPEAAYRKQLKDLASSLLKSEHGHFWLDSDDLWSIAEFMWKNLPPHAHAQLF